MHSCYFRNVADIKKLGNYARYGFSNSSLSMIIMSSFRYARITAEYFEAVDRYPSVIYCLLKTMYRKNLEKGSHRLVLLPLQTNIIATECRLTIDHRSFLHACFIILVYNFTHFFCVTAAALGRVGSTRPRTSCWSISEIGHHLPFDRI